MSDQPSNAASEFLRYAFASFTEDGSPPEESVRAVLTDDFTYDDRRSGPNFPDADADSFAKFFLTAWQTGADGQPRFEAETLAERGERFAAVVAQVDYGNGMVGDFIIVIGLGASLSMMQRMVDFDIDDVDGAIAELDRLHGQSETS